MMFLKKKTFVTFDRSELIAAVVIQHLNNKVRNQSLGATRKPDNKARPSHSKDSGSVGELWCVKTLWIQF